MNIDEINDAQDNTLSALRDRIKARQASVFDAEPAQEPFPVRQLELVEVPEIMEPEQENGEFSLTRHSEIAFRLEALYNNYLYRVKFVFDEPSMIHHEEFETALKELCRTQEQLLCESIKPRF